VVRFIDDMQTVAFETPGTWSQLAIRLRESGLLAGDLGVRFHHLQTLRGEEDVDPGSGQISGVDVQGTEEALQLGRVLEDLLDPAVAREFLKDEFQQSRVGPSEAVHFRPQLAAVDEGRDAKLRRAPSRGVQGPCDDLLVLEV